MGVHADVFHSSEYNDQKLVRPIPSSKTCYIELVVYGLSQNLQGWGNPVGVTLNGNSTRY